MSAALLARNLTRRLAKDWSKLLVTYVNGCMPSCRVIVRYNCTGPMPRLVFHITEPLYHPFCILVRLDSQAGRTNSKYFYSIGGKVLLLSELNPRHCNIIPMKGALIANCIHNRKNELPIPLSALFHVQRM